MDVMNAKKTKLGSDHPDTLTIMANLASTYRSQGRWDEAQKLEVIDVMNAFRTKLGSDHPDTLTNISSLEATCGNEGKLLNEPEKLEFDVVNATKVKPESGHLNAILTSITNQPPSNQDLQPVQQYHNQWENMVNWAC